MYPPAEGGSIFMDTTTAEIINCTFNNSNGYQGGAIDAVASDVTIKRSLFVNSKAAYQGGAINCKTGATVDIVHCTFYGDTVTDGAGGCISIEEDVTVNVVNSIISAVSPDAIRGTVNASYCNISGGYNGESIMEYDPQFADISIGDFKLISTSLLIDAGKNIGDTYTGLGPDIGAYECY